MKNKSEIFWLHSHTLMSTGGTRFIFEVLSRLAKKHSVTLVVEKTSKEWRTKFESQYVRVVELGGLSSTSNIYWLLFPVFYLVRFFQLRAILPKNAMVISTMFPFHSLATKLSINTIYYCFEPFAFFHDSELICTFPKVKQILLRVLRTCYGWLDRQGVRQSKLLISINPSVGRSVASVYDRVPDGYSYLGVNTDSFQPKKNIKNERFTFFHSTDFTSLKGTWFLLHALPLMKVNNYIVNISETIRDNAEFEKMQRYIQENELEKHVQFLGQLSYKDLQKKYQESDAYVFVGDPESKGATSASLSVLEASACELPVIRSIGNDDEILENQTGVYVNPRNPEEIVKAMEFFIRNPQKAKKMGACGRAYILKNYQWDQVTDRIQKQVEGLQHS